MDQSLDTFYPWNTGLAQGSFALFLDNNSGNAYFSFVLYLFANIRANRKILVLCCNKPRNHFIHLLKKNVSPFYHLSYVLCYLHDQNFIPYLCL